MHDAIDNNPNVKPNMMMIVQTLLLWQNKLDKFVDKKTK